MKDYEIRYLKKIIETKIEQAKEAIETNKKLGFEGGIKDSINELSVYDNHPADIGSEVFEQEKDFALVNHQNKYVDDMEQALKKVDKGTYGICDFCNKEIGFERMEAYPTAKLCIHCERNKTVAPEKWDEDRPVEEEVLGNPFGRTFNDNTDKIAYDGEDAWQDVQQYGSSSGPQDISVNQLIDYKNVYYGSDEESGIVEEVEKIDNDDYVEQIPEEHI